MKLRVNLFLFAIVILLPASLFAQGTQADYERANGLRKKYSDLAINIPEKATWIGSTNRFYYRKSVKGGYEWVVVEAPSLTKKPAFDHNRLAAALSQASGEELTGLTLPFAAFNYTNNEQAITFTFGGVGWTCTLNDYTCRRPSVDDNPARRGAQAGRQAPDRPRASPDGQSEAYIDNFNVWVKQKGKKTAEALSFDGSEGNYYTLQSIAWSPDSKKIAAYRVRPGYHRKINYIESSPKDQLQPKYSSLEYAKPGDALDINQPVLFILEGKKQINIDNALFDNPYALSFISWWKDSRAFTFEFNQRGHQIYRVIEVDAATGKTRAIISEEPKTFFCYSGKKFRQDLDDGKGIIWMSERDGWNHLYMYNGMTGQVDHQITKGNWVVRSVERVDVAKKQIYFGASGMYPGKDPYFNHYFRINFDGSGMTPLTEGDYNHQVSFSADLKYFVHTWSRVDVPTSSQLVSLTDGKVVGDLEHGDIKDLLAAGWKAPEVFTAMGRDGRTDIWGVIYRPTNLDPSKKYPVIENIYAGPQDSFVPKSFSRYNQMQSLAELGFVVVQVDGMGTSNRSKAFHDVCWKNLGDAGFPDRILWHKAIAAKYPYYDITRVGIYGTSAGGQNALGAMLFHPEFYKVSVSASGCHDNRMDKIWWNEQWMGWPLGPQYAEASNVDNAHKLVGKLLLIEGEMDTNVDPASTMQVVNALIKANKMFDLLVIPGAGHTSGGTYGDKKRYDFFVHNLLGVEPPDWNMVEEK